MPQVETNLSKDKPTTSDQTLEECSMVDAAGKQTDIGGPLASGHEDQTVMEGCSVVDAAGKQTDIDGKLPQESEDQTAQQPHCGNVDVVEKQLPEEHKQLSGTSDRDVENLEPAIKDNCQTRNMSEACKSNEDLGPSLEECNHLKQSEPATAINGVATVQPEPQPIEGISKPPKPPAVERIWPRPRKADDTGICSVPRDDDDQEKKTLLLSREEQAKIVASFKTTAFKGAEDSDEMVTWADILNGAVGHVEQEAAKKLQEQPIKYEYPKDFVYYDDTGYDMRVGERAKKRQRVAQEEKQGTTHKAENKGTAKAEKQGNGSKAEEAPKKRGRPPKTSAKPAPAPPPPKTSAKPASAPAAKPASTRAGSLPPGWEVIIRDGPSVSKPYKLYRAPDGKSFQSYAQSKVYWEKLGQVPVGDTSPGDTDEGQQEADQPLVEEQRMEEQAVEEQAVKEQQIVKQAVEEDDVEFEAVESTIEPKYLPAEFSLETSTRTTGSRAGVVDKYFIHTDGTKFTSMKQAMAYARKKNLQLLYLPADYDFRNVVTWVRQVGACSPQAPQVERKEQALLQDAVLRINATLGINRRTQLSGGLSSTKS